MKILIISPSNTFPALSGGAVRINAFLKYLAKRNKVFYIYNKYHQVKEVREGKIKFNVKNNTKSSNIELYPVGPSVRAAQLFNPFLLIKSYRIIKQQKIDLIIGEFAWSGMYLLLLKLLMNVQYIIDEHNIEYDLVKFNYSITGKLISPMVKFYEKLAWRFSKYIFCVSENDKKTIIDLGVGDKKIVVIPHGIDNDFLKKINKRRIRKRLNLDPDDSIILFFGKLDYHPNKEAISVIYKEILPRTLKIRKNIKFLIVGSNPPKIKHENIIFTGPVENIKNYINASDLVINPLLNGTGVRSKILEAIACGKRVISTSIGAGELVYGNIKDFLVICDDWDDFSEEVIKNLSKKDGKPKKDFLDKYRWENIINKVNLLLQQDNNSHTEAKNKVL